MTALKRWFSGNKSQQNMVDSIFDELLILKFDECATAHEHMNQFMRLIESLKTSQEEIPPQTAHNLFLNKIFDLDYENFRKMLKITKRKVPIAECLQDIR